VLLNSHLELDFLVLSLDFGIVLVLEQAVEASLGFSEVYFSLIP